MFKSIIAFIKAHTLVTAISTTVVVSTAVVTPIVVENYKLDKDVKENLYMLVASNFQSDENNNQVKNEVQEVVNTENQEQHNEISSETLSVSTNKEPLKFRIEKVYSQDGELSVDYTQGDVNINNAKSKGIEYKIVPSYDKDFSEWTKAEKEAYQKALDDIRAMAEEDYNSVAQNEKQILDNMQKEFDLINSGWSERYLCPLGEIYYNSYTNQYKGNYTKKIIATTYNDGSGMSFQYDQESFSDMPAEEFRNTVYPIMIKIYEEGKNKYDMFSTSEEKLYIENLKTVYHLSD